LSGSAYKRDKVFWLVALQTGVFGVFMGGFGPALPLLQEDQGTSGAVAGLHGTALGLASIIAGALNARVAHKFGRYHAIKVFGSDLSFSILVLWHLSPFQKHGKQFQQF